MQDRTYRFGDCELVIPDGEFRRGQAAVPLQEKPFLLLLALLDNPQKLVTRQQLRERLWDDATFVDYEQGINVAIKKVRDALGDSADHPTYIETVAKKGYKFLLPVEVIERQAAAEPANHPVSSSLIEVSSRPQSRWGIRIALVCFALLILLASSLLYSRYGRAATRQIQSIAVLPLQNLSADPEQEYFADGMTDELITDLAKIQRLRVISRTSIMRYKNTVKPLPEIARELHVDAIIEGTMLRSRDRVRIRVQLIDARTDSHLWAEAYERNEHDALSLQNEVASAIARHIGAELISRGDPSPEPNFEAYSAYLKGRYEWNKRTPESLRKSIEYLQEALNDDPNYALAHEGLAESYAVLSDYDVLPPAQSYAKAKSEALRALALDDGLGPAHATLATIKEELEWDWAGADREFQRSIELTPNSATAHEWYSEYLLRVGRLDAGVAEMKLAEELDPGSPLMNAEMGGALYWARRYDEAIQQLRKALAMEPGFAYAHSWLGFAYEQKGMRREALEEFQKAVDLSGGSSGFIAALGHGYALTGNPSESRRIILKLQTLSRKSYVSPYDIAIVYTSLGDKDQALHWLEAGYATHDPAMDMLRVEPALDSLRSDGRFQSLISRVGLPKLEPNAGS